jgi:uncharacterized protein YcbX
MCDSCAVHLAAIHTYPIKGCYRVEHERATVEPWGLAGDRRWLIVDAATGRALTQRVQPALTQIKPEVAAGGGLVLRTPDLPDLAVPEPVDGPPMDVTVWRFTGPAARAGEAADDWLSEALDRKVMLVWLDDPTRRAVNPEYGRPGDVVSFADGYPVLLANAASLAALNDWLVEDGSPEWPLPMARFRANLVVEGAPAWAEDGWLGRRVWVGGTAFRAVKPCPRCVVTTTDQDTGEQGDEPLRTLARHRQSDLGLLFAVNLIPDATGTVAFGDAVDIG